MTGAGLEASALLFVVLLDKTVNFTSESVCKKQLVGRNCNHHAMLTMNNKGLPNEKKQESQNQELECNLMEMIQCTHTGVERYN